jgi:hypothetical protein
MRKPWLIPAACVAVAALLGACSMDKPDLRYRDSRLREPLAVPQGLDGPQYSQTMDIPPAGTTAATEGAASGNAPASDSPQIELPPDLRAGGPSPDQGSGQDKGPSQANGPDQDKGPGRGKPPDLDKDRE